MSSGLEAVDASAMDRMTATPSHVDRYLAGAGVLRWEPSATAACQIDDAVAVSLQIAALLEEDTAISAAHARSFGLDRAADLGAFLPVWELEEAEHGRILRAIASTVAGPDPRSRVRTARRRSVAAVPLRGLGRARAAGLAYCTLGAAAEYLAIISYQALANQLVDETARSLLKGITHQEGRHLAFFLAAARARGDATSTTQGRLARRAVRRLWEPIGVSSLGPAAWRAANGHWLDDDHFRRRAERMDAIVDSIPHLAGLRLMETFLREWDRQR